MAIIRYPQQTPRVASNPFADAGTYIIDGVLVVSNSFPISANVTLIFLDGGKITTNNSQGIIIEGDNTRLMAPISQIFGDKINVKGYWTIDRAYPQWFCNFGYRFVDSPEGPTTQYASPNNDWSVAINKAIIMKGTGEVMIPRGHYYIKNPIKVSFGITLVGESGRNSTSNSGSHAFGTRIEANAVFNSASLFYVNKYDNQEEWDYAYPTPVTKIANIEVKGNLITTTFSTSCTRKGIVSYGACVIDTVIFNNLSTGIQFKSGLYSDARQVYNCVFDYNQSYNYASNSYAIDLEWLGDAVTIQNNHVIQVKKDQVGALRLKMCNGGLVSSNIFNGDVLIQSCKGIVYECNHMEGSQLKIDTSNVAVRRNFLEKREKCNIYITGNGYYDESIVDLEGNSYICAEYSSRSDLSQVSQTDVRVDEHSIVNIKDEYRYWTTKGTINKMYTFGIQLEGAAEFNEKSHLYSKLCYIHRGKVVSNEISFPGEIPSLDSATVNRGIEWLCDSGIYRYDSIVINGQPQAKVFTKRLENSVFPTDSNVCSANGGLLFSLTTETDETRNVNISMIRSHLDGSGNVIERKSITLYVCGAAYLHDNGICISGYKWMNP